MLACNTRLVHFYSQLVPIFTKISSLILKNVCYLMWVYHILMQRSFKNIKEPESFNIFGIAFHFVKLFHCTANFIMHVSIKLLLNYQWVGETCAKVSKGIYWNNILIPEKFILQYLWERMPNFYTITASKYNLLLSSIDKQSKSRSMTTCFYCFAEIAVPCFTLVLCYTIFFYLHNQYK